MARGPVLDEEPAALEVRLAKLAPERAHRRYTDEIAWSNVPESDGAYASQQKSSRDPLPNQSVQKVPSAELTAL